MIKRIKSIEYFVITMLLTGFYFFLIAPASGIIGGLLFFLLFGKIIPTLAILCGTYFIVQNIPRIKKTKILFFIFISCVLGLNTNIFKYIRGYQPYQSDIEIIQPLREAPSSDIYFNYQGVDIKRNPFQYYKLGANEGSMSSYFESPTSLYGINTWEPLLDNGWGVRVDKVITPDTNYFVNVSSKEKGNYIDVIATIEDKWGGKIKMHASYPAWLRFEEGRILLKNDKNFWSHAFDQFLHDNIWVDYLPFPHSEVKTPLTFLGEDFRKKIFISNDWK